VLAGYIGIPAALGGGNRLEHFLHPSFVARGAAAELQDQRASGGPGESPVAIGEPAGGDRTAVERSLMLVSSVVALTGIGLAWFFFGRRRDAADRVARGAAGLRRLLLNKYYVDELYDAAVVQPIKVGSERLLWKGVDVEVIDGAVNGAGTFVNGSSSVLRQLQTGSVRTYAVSLFLGVVVILGYYLWRFVAIVSQRGV
jgi:NADH-quinone oxidoreductase subunit L